MLNKATILERWPNKVLQLCHKWDHWSCLIIKITHFPSWLFYTFGSVFAFQNNNKDTKPQQSMAFYFLFFLFSISSFQSKNSDHSHPSRENCSWHTAREPNEKNLPAECRWHSLRRGFMQASDLDLFDVHLEQQMPARWQVGWNVLRSWVPRHKGDHKVRTVWSSTPGGRFQKALPAACHPHSLRWIIKSLEAPRC